MTLKIWNPAAHAIGMMLAGWIHREEEAAVAYQKEEIRALREMLGGKRLRFTDAQRRRLALKARALSHAKRGPGRPPKPQHIRDLVVRLARENVGWGYTRIRDVMEHLGHEIPPSKPSAQRYRCPLE